MTFHFVPEKSGKIVKVYRDERGYEARVLFSARTSCCVKDKNGRIVDDFSKDYFEEEGKSILSKVFADAEMHLACVEGEEARTRSNSLGVRVRAIPARESKPLLKDRFVEDARLSDKAEWEGDRS